MIKVTKESKKLTSQFFGALESCVICSRPTAYWWGGLVPVCPRCAKARTTTEEVVVGHLVPAKRIRILRERVLVLEQALDSIRDLLEQAHPWIYDDTGDIILAKAKEALSRDVPEKKGRGRKSVGPSPELMKALDLLLRK